MLSVGHGNQRFCTTGKPEIVPRYCQVPWRGTQHKTLLFLVLVFV